MMQKFESIMQHGSHYHYAIENLLVNNNDFAIVKKTMILLFYYLSR
jgi:hypothetical protein